MERDLYQEEEEEEDHRLGAFYNLESVFGGKKRATVTKDVYEDLKEI